MQAVIKRKTYLGYLVDVINNKGNITTVFSFATQICGELGILCSPVSSSQKLFSVVEGIQVNPVEYKWINCYTMQHLSQRFYLQKTASIKSNRRYIKLQLIGETKQGISLTPFKTLKSEGKLMKLRDYKHDTIEGKFHHAGKEVNQENNENNLIYLVFFSVIFSVSSHLLLVLPAYCCQRCNQ